jgi:hypothetical protein
MSKRRREHRHARDVEQHHDGSHLPVPPVEAAATETFDNIVLFGAGASYREDVPSPPLGRDLYESLVGRDPQHWLKVRPYFQKDFSDFEAGMIAMMNPSVEASSMLRSMGSFFAQFSVRKVTRDPYTALLKSLKAKRLLSSTLFSSLNYDVVFEHAVMRLGYEPTYECVPPHVLGVRKRGATQATQFR